MYAREAVSKLLRHAKATSFPLATQSLSISVAYLETYPTIPPFDIVHHLPLGEPSLFYCS